MDNVSKSDTSVGTEFNQRLASLYSYLAKHLQIKTTPKIVLTKNQQNSKNPFGMTGYYDAETKTIRLFISDRHDTDILRSFAHEVIHHWQNENGTLHPAGEKDNTQTNDHYAQHDQNLRKREMEAYLFGNILFRDWQDENRYGPPKSPPIMPQPINENLKVANSTRIRDGFKQLMDQFVKEGTISSYHRELTSGDMNAGDFTEDFANKLVSSFNQLIKSINDRSNWESDEGGMIQEDANWDGWIQSMVQTIEDYLLETSQHTCNEYDAYALLKTDFRADAPSKQIFEKAAAEAIAKLKSMGRIEWEAK